MTTGSSCTGSGSAPSYTHQAGDQFIFKGGVTWPAACFDMYIPSGGSASAQDYYGTCGGQSSAPAACSGATWPSTGWTRPLFDLNYSTPARGDHVIISVGAGAFSPGQGYITIDDLEIAHQAITGSATDVISGTAIALGGTFATDASVGTIVENCYLHDWVGASSGYTSGGVTPAYSAGGVSGAALFTNNVTSDANGYYYVGGSKNTEVQGGGCQGCVEMSFSTVHDGFIGCSACVSVHDSEFYNIKGGLDIAFHTHVIYEDQGNVMNSKAIYNNAIHDNYAGLNINVDYGTAIYNNVMWNNLNNVAIYLDQCPPGQGPCGDNSAIVGYVFNNTIDQSNGSAGCYKWYGTAGLGTLYQQNNICIPGSNSAGSFSVTTLHSSNNYTMSTSEASTYGFTSANKYAPTSSDSNIAAQGVNPMSSLALSSTNFLSALQYDTAGAPWYGSSYNLRTTWAPGAFVIGASTQSASKPTPPSGLSVTIN